MTDAIEFGPEIKRGSPLWPEGQERPVWLEDDVRMMWLKDQWGGPCDVADHSWFGGFYPVMTIAIRLPIDHPASIAQRWNDDNPGEKPFDRVWFGGDAAPADWDGGDVLFENGDIGDGNVWDHHESRAPGRIIAYRSKPSEQTVEDDGYVRVPVMTEAEWEASLPVCAIGPSARGLMSHLGIIRPETPVERFKRENPYFANWTVDELIEAAAKFFGGAK